MKWNKTKIYSIYYLLNEELTEDDLFNLFETSSLNKSLILGMFYITWKWSPDETDKINEVKRFIKDNDRLWMDKKFWNFKQYQDFRKILIGVAKNVYQYNSLTCEKWADQWLMYYGFRIQNNKPKRKYKKH